MFAYLLSRDAPDYNKSTAALIRLARDFDVPESCLNRLTLSSLQLDYFDTANELQIFRDDQILLILTGTVINKTELLQELQFHTENTAELLARLYGQGTESLARADGHFAFLLYDTQDNSITVVADRFHRYSVVYCATEAVYISSHTFLLHALASRTTLDMEAFSQAIHFRWLIGERNLFGNIRQVLSGTTTKIDTRKRVSRTDCFDYSYTREKSLDLNYWVQEVDSALDACLSRIAKQHEVIGVPLSGGVDSSLLLAKAKEHFSDCIAVTARFKNWQNPELENARYIAKQAGVEHIIADIDSEKIRLLFPRIVKLHEQPPRNYSDLALACSLEALTDQVDAFLYGEGADTLFGNSAVHDVVAVDRLTKPLRILPRTFLRVIARAIPERGHRMKLIKWALSDGIDSFIYAIDKIAYVTPPWQVFPCARSPNPDPALNDRLGHEAWAPGDRAAVQILTTGVMNHIENTGRLATYFGLHMYAPFVLSDVRSIAKRLPFEMLCRNGVYKPVLRELACRYFDRKVIYADKFGFPTPTLEWLEGPLSERVNRVKSGLGFGRDYYSHETLSSLVVDEDYEHFWFAICLDELLEQFSLQGD